MLLLRFIMKKKKEFRKKRLAESFQETEQAIAFSEELKNSIIASRKGQVCISEDAIVKSYFDEKKYNDMCPVSFTNSRAFNSAELYKSSHTCVLNFACSTDPGGGVIGGSIGQEEALCTSSTLYQCLIDEKMWKEFYGPHIESQYFLGYDDCIYTPGVTVFRTDEFYPRTRDIHSWFNTDVITCSAPALHRTHLYGASLYEIHYKRLQRILDIAAGKDVEVVILGAFGCGAFKNEPHVVAEAMMNVVKHYRYCFKHIVFSVPAKDKCEKNENSSAFRDAVFNFFDDDPNGIWD